MSVQIAPRCVCVVVDLGVDRLRGPPVRGGQTLSPPRLGLSLGDGKDSGRILHAGSELWNGKCFPISARRSTHPNLGVCAARDQETRRPAGACLCHCECMCLILTYASCETNTV